MDELVKLTHKPEKGEVWEKEFPKAQAEKMVKLGRWKKAPSKPETKK